MAFMGSASLLMMLPLWAINKWLPEAENNFSRRGCRLWFSSGETVFKVIENMWENKCKHLML
jgi:hypothetical protein